MKPMENLQDLIDEAKVRALWWALCIFGISYFLSHTSKSMWMNIPISVLILLTFRYLSNEVEFCWKIRSATRQTFLSTLQKEQLPLDGPNLSTSPPVQKWTQKINSKPVEAAVRDFTDKIVQDFVVDLWYMIITPDQDGPELIRGMILDAIGEISGRMKQVNLSELLTSNMVNLVGNHLELFRKTQSIIGIEVMATLSSDERDEHLKYHLKSSNELHPALVSPGSDYKVLQRLVEGVLAIVLEHREPLIRCISRDVLTCFVFQPLLNIASPAYINELIELAFLDAKDDKSKDGDTTEMAHKQDLNNDCNFMGNSWNGEHGRRKNPSSHSGDAMLSSSDREISQCIRTNMQDEDPTNVVQSNSPGWATTLDAAAQIRAQVLAPEFLDDKWARGSNYQKRAGKLSHGTSGSAKVTSVEVRKEIVSSSTCASQLGAMPADSKYTLSDAGKDQPRRRSYCRGWDDDSEKHFKSVKHLKRSSSSSDLKKEWDVNTTLTRRLGETVGSSQSYNSGAKGLSESIISSEGYAKTPKIKCRVAGAFFEKTGSNSFAVYSIAVTDTENKSWSVNRRFRNFERLHRHLKDIPNYNLVLPPKRFLSSSTDDRFVLKRCILLDNYLQDLLKIANIVEQHEVLDFLSTSSKNYSFGKTTSVIRSFAVNVDDVVYDIVRQFKGVSDPRHKSSSRLSSFGSIFTSGSERSSMITNTSISEDGEGINQLGYDNMDMSRSFSEEETLEEGSSMSVSGWHSDNELDTEGFSHLKLKPWAGSRTLGSRGTNLSENSDLGFLVKDSLSPAPILEDTIENPVVVPPEWSPSNLSAPILALVDELFQLNRRGWIRRQVFWTSIHILQLMMEDAIDEWLLRKINWLRNEVVIAKAIRWVQDILWPNGTFFIKLGDSIQSSKDDIQEDKISTPDKKKLPRGTMSLSFEEELEARRRASVVKELLLGGGAPATLVNLIGPRQYKRCARDVYYFLQSTVCIKQLTFAMLELVLESLFPELKELIADIHGNKETHPT